MTDYPAGLTLRPIEAWPGVETKNRVVSNFSAPWRATLKLLDTELRHLSRGRVSAARANSHPDRNMGARAAYDAVDAAVQLLEREGRL